MPGHTNGNNSPSNIIGYDGQGRPIYRAHSNDNGMTNGNGMRDRNNNGNGNTVRNSNPVTRTFFAPERPRYFKPNGQMVSVGAPLHQHLDGTIMTEHSMGINDNSVVVTTSSPSSTQRMTRTTTSARTTRVRGANGMRSRMTTTRASNRFGQRGGTSYGASSGE